MMVVVLILVKVFKIDNKNELTPDVVAMACVFDMITYMAGFYMGWR